MTKLAFFNQKYGLTPLETSKKLAFFDQKRGLTPLQKCDFCDFEKFCFYTQKKFLFYLDDY